VKRICTTDDPADDLKAHELLTAVRPDKAMRADKPDFPQYVARLEGVVGYPIDTVEDMRRALRNRIEYFDNHRCRVSDHALDYCFCVEADEARLDDIFACARLGRESPGRNSWPTTPPCSSPWARSTPSGIGSCSSTSAASGTIPPSCSPSWARTPASMPPVTSLTPVGLPSCWTPWSRPGPWARPSCTP
ncbi:MAG: glucuronate isomerase, partial [Oscillospiraceae bacterium]|nr:glucuronate isomerase [Oscillospiraceae bacterium]